MARKIRTREVQRFLTVNKTVTDWYPHLYQATKTKKEERDNMEMGKMQYRKRKGTTKKGGRCMKRNDSKPAAGS